MAIRVLILGGTTEAVQLAEACAKVPDLEITTSLAGRTRTPCAPPGALRIGGFGGADGLERYLRAQAIDRLVDATHPFALQIGRNAVQACRAAGVPRLRLLRPPWQRQPGDRWIEVESLAEAARRLPQRARVFLSVGRSDLGAFAGLEQWFLVRTIEPAERAWRTRAGSRSAARFASRTSWRSCASTRSTSWSPRPAAARRPTPSSRQPASSG